MIGTKDSLTGEVSPRQAAYFLSSTMIFLVLPGSLLAQDSEENEAPFAVADVFLELNNTDGDLGLQALIDGEPWKRLNIEDARGKKIFQVRASRDLAKQGLNEIFFESAEPGFDQLPPDAFLARFPEGVYEISAKTLDGHELESEVEITHLLPAPPANVAANDKLLPLNCAIEAPPSVGEPVTITWDSVDFSHPTIGVVDAPINIDRYEVVVEFEALDNAVFTMTLGPDQTAVDIPSQLIALGDEFKLGIVVEEVSGNRTVIESCFAT